MKSIEKDIQRIRRAKEALKDNYVDKRTKNEAIVLIRKYREIANEVMESGSEDEREKARELLYELRIL